MSLSDPRQSSNPATKFIEWTGKHGSFVYYDKEKDTRVEIPTPIQIIPLDQLKTIVGYNAKEEKGIFSNEVHNTNEQELDVRYHGGAQIAKGLYAEIKKDLAFVDAKFCQSVYAALISPDGKELELVNFKFYGSSLGPWIDAKVGDTGNVIILDKDPQMLQKGDTKYYQPRHYQMK